MSLLSFYLFTDDSNITLLYCSRVIRSSKSGTNLNQELHAVAEWMKFRIDQLSVF